MSTSFYPRRPSRLALALRTLGGWEFPWLVRITGKILLGALAILFLPIAIVGAVPFGALWLLAKLGSRVYDAGEVLITGRPKEE